jgi:hypothetical protein
MVPETQPRESGVQVYTICYQGRWLCVIEEHFPWGGLIYTRYETLVETVRTWV